jgi:Replication protein
VKQPNAIAIGEMIQVIPPSRPSRLGTRRRHALQARVALARGASCARAAGAPSLDTEKVLLATSEGDFAEVTMQDFKEALKSEEDEYRQKQVLHRELMATVWEIFQGHARAAKASPDVELIAWWAAYEQAREFLPGESGAEQWRRVELWLKENKPTGENAKAIKWEKQYFQLQRCQREWIGYRAACCGDRTAAVAVPVGCNHRLCPMCAHHRLQGARVRIKSMFDRLTHPVFITLTVPNTATIRKHDFTLMRQRVRQFLAQHKPWIAGGVYSLETTYNRAEQSWHVHCHVLADVLSELPSKAWKVELAGEQVYAFTQLKLRLEFDWLRLWTSAWGKKPRKDANAQRIAGDTYQFESWVRLAWANTVREYDRFSRRYVSLPLEPAEFLARNAWNKRNRRALDIRPVTDRERAAHEVLKYITKGADFSDSPEAVEQFMDASKGARMVQTFGTWYGAKFDTVFDPEHMDDWGEMKCSCGLNCWESIGVFYRKDVHMTAGGRWMIRPEHQHACRGTVPRPTIRALEPDAPQESDWITV